MKAILASFVFLLLPAFVLAREIKIPLLEKIAVDLSLPLLGAILGSIDGIFNPCALAVLLFLVGYLLAIGSRKKWLQIVLAYSLTIFMVYSLFMYGILNVILMIGYLYVVKMIVGVVLLMMGTLEIKDFFWYGKGPSLKIPKASKPAIERLIKLATIPSAILLGFLVSFVEIPCAGAFPLFYITALAERVSGIATILYIFWYNAFFILPMIFLTVIFYLGLSKVEKVEGVRLQTRRYMRLLSGTIILSIALLMLGGAI